MGDCFEQGDCVHPYKLLFLNELWYARFPFLLSELSLVESKPVEKKNQMQMVLHI